LKTRSIEIANKWLQAGGKRWRPLIMLALHNELSTENVISNEQLAKCWPLLLKVFHKASLAHDDIADNDAERYGEESLLKSIHWRLL
jgi:geranylgeranyl pyrophosphate synthase